MLMPKPVAVNKTHFKIVGNSQKSLSLNIPGQCVVLFKLTTCPKCREFEPIFVKLASSTNSIKTFAICNVDDRIVSSMSKGTNAEISTVPIVLFFDNSIPRARFNTPTKNMQTFTNFINKCLENFPQQSSPAQFHNPKPVSQPEMGGNAPNLGNAIRGGQSQQYKLLGNGDEEDETVLSIPDNVIPHNEPWSSIYKSME